MKLGAPEASWLSSTRMPTPRGVTVDPPRPRCRPASGGLGQRGQLGGGQDLVGTQGGALGNGQIRLTSRGVMPSSAVAVRKGPGPP